MSLFDEVAGVSRKLIICLKSNILLTVKPESADGWSLEEVSSSRRNLNEYVKVFTAIALRNI